MKRLLSIITLALAANVYAACEQMYPFGKPEVRGNYTELCRKGYAVIHDNDRKIPFLTFEHLTPETIGRGQSERTRFKADRDLPPQFRSTPKDYENTPLYDRGHLANAQNAGDDEAMADTMLMSNIVPQVYTMNRGSWKVLETQIAKAVRRGTELYVITGVLTNKSHEQVGHGVVVPTHLFKVVIDPSTQGTVAYLMPNETNNKSYRDFKIPVGELESIIGVDLMPLLRDKIAGRPLN